MNFKTTLHEVIEGVREFQTSVFPRQQQRFQKLAKQQNPRFLFITCGDSRISPDLITQTNPGDLFICRNAGNMVPAYSDRHGGVTATIEYAVVGLKVEHIILCGHSDCGAMKGILNPELCKCMPVVREWLANGETAKRMLDDLYPLDMSEEERLRIVALENIVAQLDHLRTHPCVSVAIAAGRLSLHGWFYDIEHGLVTAFDSSCHEFVELDMVTPGSQAAHRRIPFRRKYVIQRQLANSTSPEAGQSPRGPAELRTTPPRGATPPRAGTPPLSPTSLLCFGGGEGPSMPAASTITRSADNLARTLQRSATGNLKDLGIATHATYPTYTYALPPRGASRDSDEGSSPGGTSLGPVNPFEGEWAERKKRGTFRPVPTYPEGHHVTESVVEVQHSGSAPVIDL